MSRLEGRGRPHPFETHRLRDAPADEADKSGLLFLGLRRIPQRVHFGQSCVLRALPWRGQRALDRLETALEFEIGGAQNILGSALR